MTQYDGERHGFGAGQVLAVFKPFKGEIVCSRVQSMMAWTVRLVEA